ncbi:MAG: hypothetical protein KDE47_07975, partial [Caldilineaceae bacterium]|nr:hypothetical protein [Caldilineaceae bacterium]
MTAAEGPLVDSRSMNLGDANSTDVSTDCLDKIDIFTHSWIQNIDLSTVPPTLLDERDESQLAITDRGQLVSGTTSVSGGGMAANTTVSTQSESQLAGSGNYKGTATFSADWSGPATPITAEFIDTRLGWTMRLKATVEQPVQFSIDYTVTGGYFILRKDDEDPIELTGSGKIAGTLL